MVALQRLIFRVFIVLAPLPCLAQSQPAPDEINFTRQGVRRFVFDDRHTIPLAALKPAEVIGLTAMYPVRHYSEAHAQVTVKEGQLLIDSDAETHTVVWFGGFNPFATYTLAVASSEGEGAVGFEFADAANTERFAVTVAYSGQHVVDVKLDIKDAGEVITSESIATDIPVNTKLQGKVILQLLGSGLTVYIQHDDLPQPIAQADFSQQMDLREKRYMQTFQSRLAVQLKQGTVGVNDATATLSSGMGLADIRAMTYEDGSPLLDQGRLWYTMTIRGRALPHHVQGVFSMDPTVFDLRFEGGDRV